MDKSKNKKFSKIGGNSGTGTQSAAYDKLVYQKQTLLFARLLYPMRKSFGGLKHIFFKMYSI